MSGEQASEHSCAPTSSGNRVPHVPDSPALAEQQESLAKCLPCPQPGGRQLSGKADRVPYSTAGVPLLPMAGDQGLRAFPAPAALQGPHSAAGQQTPHHVPDTGLRGARSPSTEFVRKAAFLRLISYLT